MPIPTKPVPFAAIESRIHLIRGSKVMLDADLAELYGVTTKNLNKAVERNRNRFPDDFMYQLTRQEFTILMFQFGTSSRHGGRRHMPYAFTQEGIAMLSSVLRSPRAVAVNVEIMRAFIRMRGMLVSVDELARKLEALERKALAHDKDLEEVFEALRELMTPPEPPRREIGFHARPEDKGPAAKRGRLRDR
jgi:phage regulator Rha-like protein